MHRNETKIFRRKSNRLRARVHRICYGVNDRRFIIMVWTCDIVGVYYNNYYCRLPHRFWSGIHCCSNMGNDHAEDRDDDGALDTVVCTYYYTRYYNLYNVVVRVLCSRSVAGRKTIFTSGVHVIPQRSPRNERVRTYYTKNAFARLTALSEVLRDAVLELARDFSH